MTYIEEAAGAADSAKKALPGLAMKLTIESYGVCILAHYKMREVERRVSWNDINHAIINVLAMQVKDVGRMLAAVGGSTPND